MKFAFLLSAMLSVGISGVATAAEPSPEVPGVLPREAGTYAHLFTLEFKPGKSDEGVELLRKHLVPAWESAGIEVTVIESLVGTRDVFLIIPLVNGPEYFNFLVSEQDAAAWTALSERLGPDQAEKTIDRFVALLESQSQDFVFIPGGKQ